MKIYFVLGTIGAGKTVYIREYLLRQHPDLVYLSADGLAREYGIMYLEAREMMQMIMDYHVDKSIAFVTEGTGQHDDLYGLLTSYRDDPEIELHVTYIDVPFDVSIRRNKARQRVLDEGILRQVYQNSRDKRRDFNCQYLDYKDLIIQDFNNSRDCYY